MNVKKKVRYILSGLISLMILLLFNGCGKEKLNEKWLMEHMPRDIVTYTIWDQEIESEITSLEIEESFKDGNYDLSYCKVVLEDEYLRRNLYLIMTTMYNDDDLYLVSGAEEYMEEDVEVLQGVPEEFIKDNLRSRYGITEISNYTENTEFLSEGEWSASCDLSQSYTYLELGGSIQFKGQLDFHDMNESFPRSYTWLLEADGSGITKDWHINGTWSGATESYQLVLSIQTNDDNTFCWDGKCYYNQSSGGVGVYEKNGTTELNIDSEKKLERVEDMGWRFSFLCEYPYCSILFTPEKVSMGIQDDTTDDVQKM